jgi:DNA-binding FadR family transcriptional regulator
VTFGGCGLPDYVKAAHAALVTAVVAGDGKTAEQETRRYLVRLSAGWRAIVPGYRETPDGPAISPS